VPGRLAVRGGRSTPTFSGVPRCLKGEQLFGSIVRSPAARLEVLQIMTTVGRGTSVRDQSNRTMAMKPHRRAAAKAAARGCRVASALVLAGACTALVLGLLASPAAAVIVRVHGRALSYAPAPNAASRPSIASPLASAKGRGGAQGNPNAALLYHSPGPVMPSNTNYALYWDPAGAPAYPAGYEAGINRFFEDLAHDSGGLLNTDSILTQYGDSGGHFANYNSHFGGALIDTDPYPANGCSAAPTCLTDAQIRAEILGFVQAHKLPVDLEHEYFLLTPEGVESCMEAAGKTCSDGTNHKVYCAYHNFIETGGSALIYAEDPYVAGLGCDPGNGHPNGNPSDATIAGGLAHEHSESVTDPKLNAWFDTKGNEVGDKCRSPDAKKEYGEPLGTAPNGASYNEVINSDLYLYQQMWSNQAGECRQRAAEAVAVTKLAPKTGPSAGGTAVTITGSGFTSSATVHFGAVAAGEVTVNSATSITAVSPPGTPRAKVDVTVTTSSGTSPIVKKDRFKYKSH
jgi:IPT/TIG domain-containing protein